MILVFKYSISLNSTEFQIQVPRINVVGVGVCRGGDGDDYGCRGVRVELVDHAFLIIIHLQVCVRLWVGYLIHPHVNGHDSVYHELQ